MLVQFSVILVLCVLGLCGFGLWHRSRTAGLSIRFKLIALCLVIGIGGVGICGLSAYFKFEKTLTKLEGHTLAAIRASREHQIEHYFGLIHKQMVNFSANRMVGEATIAFVDAFERLPQEATDPAYGHDALAGSLKNYYEGEFRPRLEAEGQPWRGFEKYLPASDSARIAQGMYISNNPKPVGQKHELDRADLATSYNAAHRVYHPVVRKFLESFEYYDIFLFDLKGNLVYSVYKEADFATNVLTGPYKSSNFADVYKMAAASDNADETFIVDFKSYEPSYGAPASFVASPVFYDGVKQGVAVFQMPVNRISEIMQDHAGLGETAESYIVGEDGLMRSNSRFSEEPTLLVSSMDSDAVREALAGKTGVAVLKNHRDTMSLCAFGPVILDGLHWAVVTEMDMSEVREPLVAFGLSIAATGVVLGVVVLFLSVIFARSIVRPISKMLGQFREIAEGDGDLSRRADEDRKDELGQLGKWFNRLVGKVSDVVAAVSSASQQVVSTSNQVAGDSMAISETLGVQMQQVQQISAAAEEMTASVVEVADKAGQAREMSGSASEKASEGSEVVSETVREMAEIASAVASTATAVDALGQRSQSIGEVINVINDIADQTNLLALNAAIEAARAGEHGRGFAVVADEVRKLADRTSVATNEIGESIKAIQVETKQAVDRMSQGTNLVESGVERAEKAGESLEIIRGSSQEVGSVISTIAEASEQQSAASEEVSRSVMEIARTMEDSAVGTRRSAEAVAGLATQADELQGLIVAANLKAATT